MIFETLLLWNLKQNTHLIPLEYILGWDTTTKPVFVMMKMIDQFSISEMKTLSLQNNYILLSNTLHVLKTPRIIPLDKE